MAEKNTGPARSTTMQVGERQVVVNQAGVAAETTVYIPHITGGEDGWKDVLEVDNRGGDSATYTLELFDAQGQSLSTTQHSVSAYGYASVDLKAQVSSAVAGKATFSDIDLNFRVSYESLGGGGVAEFNLSPDLENKLAFYFANFSSIVQWKGLAIMNAGTQAATATLKAYGGGQLLGTATQEIPARSRVRNVHTHWFPEVTLSELERIEVETSGDNLAGITITGNSELSKLLFTPAGDMNGGGSPAIMPHVTGGEADWTDVLEVDNLGATGGEYTVTLYNYYGGIVDTSTRSIGAKEYQSVDIKAISAEAVTGKVEVDSGTLNCRLSYANKSGGVAEFNLSSKTASGLSFYFANASPVVEWKGLAVMNTGFTEASVTLRAYGSGKLLGTVTLALPGGTKTSNVVDNLFPGLSASQVQRVSAECESELSGISISGNADSSKMLFTPAN